jgi:dGTPase
MAEWALKQGGALLKTQSKPKRKRAKTSIACQILDWADDCAYSVHDVEDALQAQFLHPEIWKTPGLPGGFWPIMRKRAKKRRFRADAREVRERLLDLERRIQPSAQGDERAHRKAAMRNILNDLITSVSVEFCKGSRRADFSWRLIVPDEARILSVLCKSVIWEAGITDPRVAAMSAKGREILRDLFHLLMEEVIEKRSVVLFPRYYRPLIEECLDGGQM